MAEKNPVVVLFFEELEPRLLLSSTSQGLDVLAKYLPAAQANATLNDLIPTDVAQNSAQAKLLRNLLKNITTTGTTDITYSIDSTPLPDTYTPELVQADPLISLDDYRVDTRFTGLNGSGFATVVIDTGIDLNHSFFGPDTNGDGIADRIVYSYDFSGSNDPNAQDYDGHGSNVASIIASQNSTYTGVAPGVNIIALKVFPDSGGSASDTDIEEALQWVVANAAAYNIVSVNMSLGSGNYTSNVTSSWSDEMAALAGMNVMVVCASGNSFYTYQSTPGVSYPAADPSAFSIGAVWDSSGGQVNWSGGAIDYTYAPNRITSFTQRSSSMIDVMAPGAWITGANATGGTATYAGTSQATPFVSGLAVLADAIAMQELGRKLTPTEFKNVLIYGGITINDGDDENDNVTNTNANYRRVDAEGMASAIYDMAHSTIIDNASGTGVTITGNWPTATTASFPYSTNYLQDQNNQKGTKSVRFTPTITTAGAYEVSVWFPYGGSFANNVPVDITSASGTTTVTLNESTGGGQWVSLGTYNFSVGASGSVLIRTTGTTSTVVADAVKFTLIGGAPTAVNDAYNVTKNVALVVPAASGVLSNDSSTSGNPLTAIKVTDPSHGTVTLNSDGSFTYTPTSGYVGTDSFTYKANDGTADSNVATVTFTIANTAPVAAADSYSVNENAVLTIAAPGLLANDTDANSDTLTAIKVTDPGHGTVTVNSNGSFTYTPTAGYYGSDSFTYKANDGTADSNTATVSITVNSTEAPIEVVMDNTASSGITLTGTWTASTWASGYYGVNYLHDANTQGGKSVRYTPTLTAAADYDVYIWYASASVYASNTPVAIVHGGTTTTVTVDQRTGGGQWVYLGTYSFTLGSSSNYVLISDTNANSYVIADAVKFSPVTGNVAPVANNDSYSVDQDTPLVVAAVQGVLANDTDANGDTLTAIKVSDPGHGTVTLNSDGSFTYTPASGYVGTDSFTYKANDGAADSNVATVSITINPVGTATEVILDNTAASGVILTGTWTASTWAPGFYGANYLHDGNTHGGKSVSYTPTLTAAGDYDVYIWYASASIYASNTPVDIVHGGTTSTVTVNERSGGGAWVLLGTYSFTIAPASNYVLIRDTNADGYVVADAVKFTPHANVAPVANSDTYAVNQDTVLTVFAPGVLANDTDANSDPLTAVKVTDPSHGTVTLNANGSFTYTPVAGYTGSDNFTYKANDGTANSNVATVNITVNAVTGPIEVTLDNTSASGVTLTGTWTASTWAPGFYGANYLHDGNAQGGKSVHYTPTLTAAGSYDVYIWYASASVYASNTPVDIVHGGTTTTVTVNERTGGGQWVYLGTYAFTTAPASNYVLIRDTNADGYVVADAVKFTPFVGNVAPVANNDSYSVDQNTTLTVAAAQGVLANDTDANNNTLTAIKVSDPIHGTVTLNSDGSFIYTPTAGYYGSDSFMYKSNDGTADSNVATVNITVNPVGVATEVILDNTASSGITLTGTWTASVFNPGYYGSNYLHDGNARGGKSVRYTPTLTAAASYDVYIWYVSASNYAANVPVDIVHAGTTSTVTINERAGGGAWVLLGTYSFTTAPASNYVLIRDTNADGYVVADAIKFTPATGGNSIEPLPTAGVSAGQIIMPANVSDSVDAFVATLVKEIQGG